MFRFTTLARAAHPSCGGQQIFSAPISVPLANVLTKLEESREQQERHRLEPLHPRKYPPLLDGAMSRHKFYLV